MLVNTWARVNTWIDITIGGYVISIKAPIHSSLAFVARCTPEPIKARIRDSITFRTKVEES